MPVFPSVEWFQAVAELVNRDPEFRHLGTVDALVGVQVDGRVFKLVFDAFEVAEVAEVGAAEVDELDFTLVLPRERWREMIENIQANGKADQDHTLNSIDLKAADEFARSRDYYNRDKFYRFNQSFQLFFDRSAGVETRFARAASTTADHGLKPVPRRTTG